LAGSGKKPHSGFFYLYKLYKANFDLLPGKVCNKIVKVKLLVLAILIMPVQAMVIILKAIGLKP
jgi:uncharacterized membrane protein